MILQSQVVLHKEMVGPPSETTSMPFGHALQATDLMALATGLMIPVLQLYFLLHSKTNRSGCVDIAISGLYEDITTQLAALVDDASCSAALVDSTKRLAAHEDNTSCLATLVHTTSCLAALVDNARHLAAPVDNTGCVPTQAACLH